MIPSRMIYVHYCFSIMFNSGGSFIFKRWQDMLQKGIESLPCHDFIQHFFRFLLLFKALTSETIGLSVTSNIYFCESVRFIFMVHSVSLGPDFPKALFGYHDT